MQIIRPYLFSVKVVFTNPSISSVEDFDTGVVESWDANIFWKAESKDGSKISKFHIYMSEESKNSFKLIDTITESEFVKKELNPEKTYYFYIVCVNESGYLSEKSEIQEYVYF
jgi:fibronectin type 3 domain-containing protein